MKIAISAALFMSMTVPALAQSDYYVCQIDHVVHYFNDTVDAERTKPAQLEYLDYDFSLPVEEVEAGVAGPEGVFFHERAVSNGDHVFTEINGDLELMITIQMVSISNEDWLVARGTCE